MSWKFLLETKTGSCQSLLQFGREKRVVTVYSSVIFDIMDILFKIEIEEEEMARGRSFGGAGNMNNMMRQVQKLQKQMEEAQEKVDATELEASAGGGMVTIRINGKREVLGVEIKPEIVDPEDVEMLQDLIQVAMNDALAKVADLQEKEVGGLTGGLNIPGL